MRVQIFFDPSEGMTQQSFREECDINILMSRYSYNDLLAHTAQFQGQYGDFTCIPDFQSACNAIAAANEMFMTLPANIRNHFENDPGQFLAFVDNPDNKVAMQDMGLLPKDLPIKDPVQGDLGDKNNSQSESADRST